MKTYFFWGVVKSVTLPVVLVLEGSSVDKRRILTIEKAQINLAFLQWSLHPLRLSRYQERATLNRNFNLLF